MLLSVLITTHNSWHNNGVPWMSVIIWNDQWITCTHQNPLVFENFIKDIKIEQNHSSLILAANKIPTRYQSETDFHYIHLKKQFTTGREVGWGTYIKHLKPNEGLFFGQTGGLEMCSLLLGDPKVWNKIYSKER